MTRRTAETKGFRAAEQRIVNQPGRGGNRSRMRSLAADQVVLSPGSYTLASGRVALPSGGCRLAPGAGEADDG